MRMPFIANCAALLLSTAGGVVALPRAAGAPAAASRIAVEAAGFLPNRGQFAAPVRFAAQTRQGTVFITAGGAVLAMPPGPGRRSGAAVRLALTGASTPRPEGVGRQPGVTNYLLGRNRSRWVTGVPSYRQVRMAGAYPGIDLVYYTSVGRLEYDFVVKPGADPRRIRMAFTGAGRAALCANGDLVFNTVAGELRLRRPYAYQSVGGRRLRTACAYAVESGPGRSEVRLTVARYDRSRPLVVDPVIDYCTYLGGTYGAQAAAVTTDSSGNAYIAGSTFSWDFPTTDGALSRSAGAPSQRCFVSKISAATGGFVYSTYLGGLGSGGEGASGIAVTASGAAYVAGTTSSADFPVSSGALRSTMGGMQDGFLAKLDPTGSSLLYSTYLGGTNIEEAHAVAVDAGGRAYVVGTTWSADMPATAGAFQTTAPSGQTGFVARFEADCSALSYLTYLGGSSCDECYGVAVTPSGEAVVAVEAASADFPTTPGAYSRTKGRYADVAVARLSASGNSLACSTFVPANRDDYARGIALDTDGNAYVAGHTESTNLPVTQGAPVPVPVDMYSLFAVKLNADLSQLVYCTYLGGSTTRDEGALGIAVGTGGAAIIVGYSESTYPTPTGTVSVTGGCVVKLNPTGTKIVYAGMIGNSQACGVAIDPPAKTWVVGTTDAEIPVTANAAQGTYLNAYNGFAARLNLPDEASLSVEEADALSGGGATLRARLVRSDTTIGAAGSPVTFEVDGAVVNETPATTDSTGWASVAYTVPAAMAVGRHTIKATAAATDLFLGSSATGALVVRLPTAISVDAAQGEIGASVALRALLEIKDAATPIPGKSVAFTIDGTPVGVAITGSGGVARLDYVIPADAAAGTKSIGAAFTADSTHAASSGSGTLAVNRITTSLAPADVSGEIGATVTLTATLAAAGAGVSGRTVTFTVDGQSAGSSTTNSSGLAAVSYAIPSGASTGTREVRASFAGDETHASSAGAAALTVTVITTSLAAADATCEIGATTTLSATLTAGGSALPGKTVTFTVGGEAAGQGTTDATGVATAGYTVSPGASTGTPVIGASFAGDASYAAATGSGKLAVIRATTSVAVDAASGEQGETVTLSATLAAANVSVSGKAVAFTVGGVSAGAGTTNSSGIATVSYSIASSASTGPLVIAAAFDGDSVCLASDATGTLTVTKGTPALALSAPKEAAAGSNIQLACVAAAAIGGTPLAGIALEFEFGGLAAGSATTDSDGKAAIAFEIPPTSPAGSADCTVTFSGDSRYQSTTQTVKVKVNQAITCTLAHTSFSAGAGATVQLYTYLWRNTDRQLLSGKAIAFSVDGIPVGAATTDSIGYAAVSYLVRPGTTGGVHAVCTTFSGDAAYAAAGSFSTLTVSRAWAVAISLPPQSATRSQPTPLYAYIWRRYDGAMQSGKKVRFLVDGVEVGAGASNPSGYATCSYTAPATAAVGSHALSALFAGDGTCDVAQSASTLTVTAKADLGWYVASPGAARGAVARLYVYTWNKASGKAAAGKAISFQVDGATVGSATSDSTGYAAFRYTVPEGLASGSHTIRAGFAGDAGFNAGSAAGTLTVP